MKPLVIYHGNCADGFTSAWLANMYYHGEASFDQGPDAWYIDAHPGTYGELPPDCTDRTVFILDFSYPAEVLTEICNVAESVCVIDHHESAINRLAGLKLPNLSMVLDKSFSGAYLTSLYFWPDREPMEMVKLVSDRDLWQFKDKRSKPFSMGLFSYRYGVREWNDASNNIEQLCVEGDAIERKHLKDIEELIGVMTCWEFFGKDEVPTVNLPYTMASDACNMLLERYPNAPYAASWYLRADGKRVYSLRSRKGGTNVAAVAESYGGGGHENASGFTA